MERCEAIIREINTAGVEITEEIIMDQRGNKPSEAEIKETQRDLDSN